MGCPLDNLICESVLEVPIYAALLILCNCRIVCPSLGEQMAITECGFLSLFSCVHNCSFPEGVTAAGEENVKYVQILTLSF